MAAIKSPFIIIEDFVSPLVCEEIIDNLHTEIPDEDEEDNVIMSSRHSRLAEMRLINVIEEYLISDSEFNIEDYYGFKYKGMHPFDFEWYPQGCKNNKQRCENSVYTSTSKKWHQVNSKDFCGIIFLKDFRDKAPFDVDFEVNGGQLQFLTHNFSINPKRGTLVLFPGGSNFINYTSDIKIGDLHQIRFYISATTPYKYDPRKFPGNYTNWFAEEMTKK